MPTRPLLPSCVAALCLLAFSISVSLPRAAQADDASRQEIMTQYDKFSDAVKRRDYAEYLSVLTPGFTQKRVNGKIVRREDFATKTSWLLSHLAGDSSYRIAITNLKMAGDSIIVEASTTLETDMIDTKGILGPKDKTHRYAVMNRSRDTWVKRDGTWLLSLSQALPRDKEMLDGKPYTSPTPRHVQNKR